MLLKRFVSDFRPRNILMATTVLALLVIPALGASEYILHVLIMVIFWAYLGMCWNIAAGFAGLSSYGHSLYFGIGAYTSAILFAGYAITPWLGQIVGGIVSVGVAAFLSYLCFRYGIEKAYFALATIAFVEIAKVLAKNLTEITGGTVGIVIPWKPSPFNFIFLERISSYWVMLSFGLVLVFIVYMFERSKTGLACMAIREDEDAAMVSGINATKYKLIAMCLSAFFTALAGSYYVFYISYLDPLLAFNIVISIEILLPAVIGGEGTILGPIVGALFIVPVSEWLRVQLGGLSGPHMMLYGATLIVVALFLPEGLWRGIKKRLSRYLSLSNVQ